MRAGTLRDTAIVQRRGETVDTSGQPDASWTEIATTRCAVRPLAGSEYFLASGEGSLTRFEIRLRYQNKLSDFTAADRLSIGGVLYDVEAVINVRNRNIELICMCSVVDRAN